MQVVRQSRLVDTAGRPILYTVGTTPNRSGPPYETSGTGRRFRGFNDTGLNVNATLYGALATLRNRSHDAYRNNPYAKGGIETAIANEIGTGIRPRTQLPDPVLRRQVQEAFDRWVDESDADGLLSFYGQELLTDRTVKLSGEAFIRFRPRLPQDGLSVPLQLQILEPDFVPVWKNERAANGNVIRAGIEHDALGRRVAYLMYREHPGETQPFGFANPFDFVRVPAADVIHVFWPIRPGQLRGIPWLSSVLLRLHEIDQYEDAEMVRKKTAAMFALFVTRPDSIDPNAKTALGEQDDVDGDGRAILDVEPGSATILRPGESVAVSSPADVGLSFEPFLQHQLRAVARGMGLSFEQLTGDLRRVSYSSIRAGLLEFRRACETVQHALIVHQLCRRVWERWVRTAALAGAFSGSVSNDLRAFRQNERAMLAARWIPQGWKWVDPSKEVAAHVDGIRAGLESRPDAVAEIGEDFEVVDEQNAVANRHADELGLRYDSDGRYPKTGIAAPPAAPAIPPDTGDAADAAAEEAAA